MTKEFVSISADERLLEAKEAFTEHALTYLVAVGNKRCRGVLTRADLDKALSPYLDSKSEQQRDLLTLDKRIHQVMHKKFYTFQEHAALSEVETVLRGQTDAVIIINNDLGHCCGVITAQLLLAYYHTHQQRECESET
ncbi:CBS domain-containing protein [Psychromonas sp. Urea-02u-13]|uniref:CBS domain-containing protein n=1 Tax=Psychromonas sp. Urea-02u-13 TaxID=2058326 RepID=UPI001E4204CC|nr:CBS domain-containing protein [Psychromonas sp. Urea-02u-13]